MTTETSTQLAEDLLRFIRDEIAPDSEVDIAIDTDLVMSGLVDSLGVVMIVETLEQRLGIRVDPVDVVIEHFSTVSAMLDYLGRRDDCNIVPAG